MNTSQMNSALSIDVKSYTASVEPNVSSEQLVQAVLERGYVLVVVSEVSSITVRGTHAGIVGEISSFRYGLFNTVPRHREDDDIERTEMNTRRIVFGLGSYTSYRDKVPSVALPTRVLNA